MTALAIALGLVGLAAVYAARDVAVRRIATREAIAELRAECDAWREMVRAEAARLVAQHSDDVEEALVVAKDAKEIARALKAAQLGGRR